MFRQFINASNVGFFIMLNTIMILFILSQYSVTYKSKMAAIGHLEFEYTSVLGLINVI